MAQPVSELTKKTVEYGINVISGFELALYKILSAEPGNVSTLVSNNQPFIKMFADMHKLYYTSLYQYIVNNNTSVIKTMNEFQTLTNHTKHCILTIFANLFVSVHFNIDRSKLDYTSTEKYNNSLEKCLIETFNCVNVDNLFNHECKGTPDNMLKHLEPDQSFITIEISNKIEKKTE